MLSLLTPHVVRLRPKRALVWGRWEAKRCHRVRLTNGRAGERRSLGGDGPVELERSGSDKL